MALAVNDVIQLSFRGRAFGQRVLFITNSRITGIQTTRTDAQNLQDVMDWWGSNADGSIMNLYLTCLGTNYNLEAARIQPIYTVRLPYKEAIVNANGAGGGTANTGNDGGCITMLDGAVGRKHTATYHIGPLPSASIVDGFVTAGMQAALGDFGSELIGEKTVGTNGMFLKLGIWHGALNVPAINDFTDRRVQTTARVMRRRTVGVGE